MNFNDELIAWYKINKRQLPWRGTTDAYVIWLSEIILQQTRVEQGLPYFYRFLEKYPDVNNFANASEEDILKLWQGLGYYSRGRNMLKTARLVQQEFNGLFPDTYNQLIKLKGIGEYTAAAISSFAANEARAVVDGNVYRVLSRYFGISIPVNSPNGKKVFQDLATEILDKQNPGMHNQAIMEFGAMLCKPKNPLCGICPVREGCCSLLKGAVNSLPVKLKKVKVRERYLNYFLITDGATLLMNKRDDKDIWANMYDLPLIETPAMTDPEELLALPEAIAFFGPDLKIGEIFTVKKHLLTHQRLFVRFIRLDTFPVKLKANWFRTEINNLNKLAMPRVIFLFLKNIFNL